MASSNLLQHLVFLLLGLVLLVASQSYFRCSSLNQIKRRNENIRDPTDVCSCLEKQRKIVCRLHSYDLATFDLVPGYLQMIRGLLPYDQRHLVGFVFMFCLNVRHATSDAPPRLTLTPELTGDVSFDHISIAYCDQRFMNPLHLQLDPHFLAHQTDSLYKLEIEIPNGNRERINQLVENLAHAVMRLKQLRYLTLWVSKNLQLDIPERLFARYPSIDYHVPIVEIVFIDYHLKELEPNKNTTLCSQQITIGSYAFGHLKKLRFVLFQNVLIKSIDRFAFGTLGNQSLLASSLTINFTVASLQNTFFHRETFLGAGRPVTVHLQSYDQSEPTSDPSFLPPHEPFSQFLHERHDNQLHFGYKIDCKNSEVIKQIGWVLRYQHFQFNQTQIELYCTDGKSIYESNQIAS